ncbi:hypothetical protein PG996_006919 [Apiospora saccharicola]|uniref:Uncharacterized protein n=1 Tax=Apiospora saccharicola TaxID=335842 RepID=A0ABR1VA83_9PEZI
MPNYRVSPLPRTKLGTLNSETVESDWDDFYEVKHRLNDVEQEHLIAYESYIGTILGDQFQLGAIIREDEWDKRVYEVHPLMSPHWRLEATAFCLAGLPRKLQQSRKRQLGRLKEQSLCQIDQAGMKFLIHEPRYQAGSSNSARSRAPEFVLDPFQFPKLKLLNNFVNPTVTTGDSWARVAAQGRQPTISNDRPEEMSVLEFLDLVSEWGTAEKPHAPLEDSNEQTRKKARRKRRHGKSKMLLRQIPTHNQTAPHVSQIPSISAQKETKKEFYGPNEDIPCALEGLTASADQMMESRLILLSWLATAAGVDGTAQNLSLLRLEAQTKVAKSSLTLGTSFFKNTVSKLDKLADRYLNTLETVMEGEKSESKVARRSKESSQV